MLRAFLVLLIIGIAFGIGAWLTPPGILDTALKSAVGCDALLLSFIAGLGVLQWASAKLPAEQERDA